MLKWVDTTHEREVRDVFGKALTVRAQGDAARELADRFFFETVVRVHRAGEGAPYTGLKPAGTVDPAIAAADKALESGAGADLAAKIGNAVHDEVEKRFAAAHAARKHADDGVEAGRRFVRAYVQYVHFVEHVHHLVSHEDAAAHGDSGEAATPAAPHQSHAPTSAAQKHHHSAEQPKR